MPPICSLQERRFLAGDAFSIADISALCAVDFARTIELTPDPALTAVARWHAEVSARPSARA